MEWIRRRTWLTWHSRTFYFNGKCSLPPTSSQEDSSSSSTLTPEPDLRGTDTDLTAGSSLRASSSEVSIGVPPSLTYSDSLTSSTSSTTSSSLLSTSSSAHSSASSERRRITLPLR